MIIRNWFKKIIKNRKVQTIFFGTLALFLYLSIAFGTVVKRPEGKVIEWKIAGKVIELKI